MTPDTAWSALSAELQHYAPPCTGRALFTTDRLSDQECALCAAVCAGCDVAELCAAYAVADSVESGYWAGIDRTKTRRTRAA